MAAVEPDVRVYKDPGALAHAAATLFAETAVHAAAEHGRFLVCLSGGNTPAETYTQLARAPFREQIPWLEVLVFWGDERCVPTEDLNSNYRQARDLLLSRVPVPAENTHRIRTELEPDRAADEYALRLRRYADPPSLWPRFDLVLLGLGRDGHTASLFPGSPLEATAPVLAVEDVLDRGAGQRITLSPQVFNSSRQVVFLVEGPDKSKIVSSVLYGDYRPGELPAQRIRPTDGELIWMLDAAAATSAP